MTAWFPEISRVILSDNPPFPTSPGLDRRSSGWGGPWSWLVGLVVWLPLAKKYGTKKWREHLWATHKGRFLITWAHMLGIPTWRNFVVVEEAMDWSISFLRNTHDYGSESGQEKHRNLTFCGFQSVLGWKCIEYNRTDCKRRIIITPKSNQMNYHSTVIIFFLKLHYPFAPPKKGSHGAWIRPLNFCARNR